MLELESGASRLDLVGRTVVARLSWRSRASTSKSSVISEGRGGSFTCPNNASVDGVSWTRDVVPAVRSFGSSISFGRDAKAEQDK